MTWFIGSDLSEAVVAGSSAAGSEVSRVRRRDGEWQPLIAAA